MIYLLLTILLAPVVACLWSLFGQKKMGAVSLSGAVVSLLASALLFMKTAAGYSASWAFAGLPGLPFRLHVSFFNAALSLVTAVVAVFIFFYAIGYMVEEKGKLRFWSGISLFLAAMELLLFAGDWILFVTAWEILGYASYQLISTWHWNDETGKAANKAFAINRFADLGLYIGVFVIILSSGSSRIMDTPPQHIAQFGAFMLLLAVMGKSAQVPFQSWLSAAMKGPTPVSALLHSATMVAAGIVLLLKAYPLFSPDTLFWIGTVGAITILLTGLTAIFSKDIKQMLAASTSSQLGFMVLAIGAGFPGAAMAHLVAHAFMKSSLFLGAGIYQHAAGSTKFEKLAGAGKKRKVAFGGFSLAAIALSGIPPFIGYWSKDAILSAGVKSSLAPWYFFAALTGAFLTAMYMGRSMGILWKGEPEEIKKPAGLSWMQTGLFAMLLFVLGGGLFLDKMVEMAHYPIPKSEIALIGGLLAAVAGLISGWLANYKDVQHPVNTFVRDNYPVGGGYAKVIVSPLMKFSDLCGRLDEHIHQFVIGTGHAASWLSSGTRYSDEQGIDGAINALTQKVKLLGRYGRQIQSGLVHRELMWSVWGMLIFLVIMILTLI